MDADAIGWWMMMRDSGCYPGSDLSFVFSGG